MHWTIVAAISLLAGLLGLAAFFAVVSSVLKRTGGYAPGWQLRCTKCGRTGAASDAGIIRIGAASFGKRILGRCSNCQRLRWLALERIPAAAEPPTPVHDTI